MVSTRSLLSRGAQIFQNRVTNSMGNFVLRLELRHIFAQKFKVVLCSGEHWTDAFLSWPTGELKKKNTHVFT